jgi:hypothetical protein
MGTNMNKYTSWKTTDGLEQKVLESVVKIRRFSKAKHFVSTFLTLMM